MNKIALVWTLLTLSSLVFAHGEDKPGPNGGYVRMPGAFHTEVVPKNNGDFEVYLLDLEFKNPATKNSTVSAILKSDGKEIKLSCKVKNSQSFICQGSGKKSKGVLLVDASRENAKANLAEYALPLKFGKDNSNMSQH